MSNSDQLPANQTAPITPAENSMLFKKLKHEVGEAVAQYSMIEQGDRIMVCLSGGKDSYTMLDMLTALQRRAPVSFELIAVNLDQKQPGFPPHVLPEYLDELGIEYHVLEKDTYSIVTSTVKQGKTMCSLCSRLRRGILYNFADEIGATKIALGHHKNDIIETLFLNMFFNGKLKSMPPKLISDDGKHIVIRPLAFCSEADIQTYTEERAFPIIPCNLCGSQNHLQRQLVKQMIARWEQEQPGRSDQIMRSLQNVVPSHLSDRGLYDFENLKPC